MCGDLFGVVNFMKSKTTVKLEDYLRLENFGPDIRDKIVDAFKFADDAHSGQLRFSGDPYIVHPLEVARMMAEMGFDEEVIIASLLHDTVEDTGVTLQDIKKKFGAKIGELVDGVTKISRIRSENAKLTQAENIRKVLFSMVKDIRVILIKLADKLHNMRTLEYLDRDRRVRIAKETLDIYAPLAGRLGMARVKAELEDLSLKHLEPEFYRDLKHYVDQKRDSRERYIENVKKILEDEFKNYGLEAEILGRAKHFYSIYKKMKEKDRSFDEIFDLYAVRIITDSVKACYEVLGIVHKLWMPVRGRFKDYIAVPKPNMYQSLHTTVIGPEGKRLEVQIRTREMNIIAEEGIAAHWFYKEYNRSSVHNFKRIKRELAWINRLKSWQENLDNPTVFMEKLQKELLVDQIYVFTPKGDVIELPIGATPIDFAYKIHTEVGHHCIGAKVNGKIVPLRRPLKSCEVVQILTSKNAAPSLEWLDIVKTSHARHKIRAYLSRTVLKKEESREEQKVTDSRKTEQDTVKRVKRKSVVPEESMKLRAEGESNVQLRLASCCNPQPGDEIVGYITRGRGISVHRVDCRNLKSIKDFENRRIVVEWEDGRKKLYNFSIDARDRSGLLMDITTAIAGANANILEMQLKVNKKSIAQMRFNIKISDEEQLYILLESLKSIRDIISINYT